VLLLLEIKIDMVPQLQIMILINLHCLCSVCYLDAELGSLHFGGKTVVLGGDFRQVLPVVERTSIAEVIDSLLIRSLW
jgi:hypothetical protein